MSTSRLDIPIPVFRAITRVVVPAARVLTAAQWQDAEEVVAEVLSARPPAMTRQLRTFLSFVEHGARLRYGRSFTRLPADQAERWLRSFERSRVPLLRRAFWGVRTLALMGYYARPEGAAEIGYRADARGWSARPVLP